MKEIISYIAWKSEIERFSIEKFGSVEATKDWSKTQRILDQHMDQYVRSLVANGDLKQIKDALKLNREYMARYTRELRN